MDLFNMDKLRNAVDDAKSHIKARYGTEAEKKLEEALSNKNWGASSSLLNDIAQMTFDYQSYDIVMRKIYEALDNHARQWRSIYKALVLLEHLVKNGTERVVENARDHMFKIRSLSDFNYYDGNVDRGTGIRDKCKQLLELLNDNDRIREEREKAKKLRDKYVGISSGGGSIGGGFSSNQYSSGGFGNGGGYGNNSSSSFSSSNSYSNNSYDRRPSYDRNNRYDDEEDDKRENTDDLNDEVNYKKSITDDCDFIIRTFEKRAAARTAEMEGLAGAKDYLVGATPAPAPAGFVQTQSGSFDAEALAKTRFLGFGR